MVDYLYRADPENIHKAHMMPFLASVGFTLFDSECKAVNVSNKFSYFTSFFRPAPAQTDSPTLYNTNLKQETASKFSDLWYDLVQEGF